MCSVTILHRKPAETDFRRHEIREGYFPEGEGHEMQGGGRELAARMPIGVTGMLTMASQVAQDKEPPQLEPQLGVQAVTSVAFSPDGRLVLGGSYRSSAGGVARLWDASTGNQIRSFVGHAGPVGSITSVAFSPNGRYVLTGSFDKTARLWDAATGQTVRIFEGHTAEVTSVAFSRDGHYVLTSSDKTARLWDASNGKQIRCLNTQLDVASVAFSPDGRFVVTGGGNAAQIWDAATGHPMRSFEVQTFCLVTSVAFSPDARFVLAGIVTESFDGQARLWDASTGRLIRSFDGHTSEVRSVAFSPDGRIVLTGSWDKTVRLWDASTGQPIRSFEGQPDLVWSVAFSPDGRFVLAGIGDSARLWNASTGELTRTFEGRTSTITSVTFSPDGRYLLTGSFDKTARLWDLTTGQQVRSFEGQTDGVSSVAFSLDSRFVLTGGSKTARLWEATTGKPIRSFKGQSRVVEAGQDALSPAIFSPDGGFVLTGSRLGGAQLWDASTGQPIRSFEPEGKWGETSVAFSPDGRNVLTGDYVATRLWDAATGQQLRAFEGNRYAVTSVAFSPDGRYVLAGIGDGSAQLWNASTGQPIRSFEGHAEQVTSAAFSPDARIVLTGSSDKTARLWDIKTGQQIHCLDGHTGYVKSTAFSPDGRFVLTGSDDTTTRLWDAATGKELAALISFEDGEWVVSDLEGRFDTNNLDEIKAFSWVFPDQPFRALPPEIFMRDYYEPSLLPRLLAGKELPKTRPLASLNRVQPVVEVSKVGWQDAPQGLARVTVRVKRNSDPEMRNGKTSTEVYDLRVFRDGQLVGWAPKSSVEWQLMPPPAGLTREKSDKVDLARWRQKTHIGLERDGSKELTFLVQAPRRKDLKEVTFTTYAFNEDRVKSATASATLKAEKELTPRTGKAYIISVGVNRTESSPAWDLQYAANDARQMYKVVGDKLEATKQFSEVVRIRLVSDQKGKEQPKEAAATKGHVQAVLDALAGRRAVDEQLKKEIPDIKKVERAQPEDLVMLAFSSHGYTDDRGVFHMVLADIGSQTPQEQITPELQQRSLSSDELSGWLREVDAGEMVMIVDSCHSAATVEAEGFKPGPMGSRGLGQMAYDKGMRILAASKSEQSAVEREGIKHGLLSYALVEEGLKRGLADFQPKDGKILMGEWLAYGEQEVPKLFQEGEAKGSIQRKGGPGTARDAYHGSKQTPPGYQQPVLFDFSKNQNQVVLSLE